MAIPRGVTPTFTLTFTDNNLDLTAANHVYVNFKGGTEIIKSDDELTIRAKAIDVYLSQAETLSFTQRQVAIQVNWTYGNGNRGASKIVKYSFEENLLDKVVE